MRVVGSRRDISSPVRGVGGRTDWSWKGLGVGWGGGGDGRSCVGAARGGVGGGREPESRGRPVRDSGSQTAGEGPLTVPTGKTRSCLIAPLLRSQQSSVISPADIQQRRAKHGIHENG